MFTIILELLNYKMIQSNNDYRDSMTSRLKCRSELEVVKSRWRQLRGKAYVSAPGQDIGTVLALKHDTDILNTLNRTGSREIEMVARIRNSDKIARHSMTVPMDRTICYRHAEHGARILNNLRRNRLSNC